MIHPKDRVVPEKLAALEAKLREWEIRKKTGGDHGHLNKILAAKKAYVSAGLVTAEAVDRYLADNYVKKPLKGEARKQTSLFGD